MQQEQIEQAFVACASELPDKSCSFAALISLVLTENVEIGQTLVQLLADKFDIASEREQKILVTLLAEMTVCGVFTKTDLSAFYKLLIKHHQYTLLFAGLSHLPEVTAKDFKPVVDYFSKVTNGKLQFEQVQQLLEEPKTPQVLTRIPIVAAASISFPKIKVTEKKEQTSGERFGVFDEELNVESGMMVKALPPLNSVDHLIMYSQVEDILVFFSHNHQDGVKYFLSLEQNPRYNWHQVLAEVLVEQILSVPGPTLTKVDGTHLSSQCFQSWIVDMCAIKDFFQILGKIFYVLFERLNVLEFGSQKKFLSWFSLHVSNFGFKWNWKAWIELATTSELHGNFLKSALNQCVELSYYERVEEAVSLPEIKPFMPPQPEPSFSYAAVSENVAEEDVQFAQQLLAAIKEKTSLIQLCQESHNANKLQIVVQCILQHGSKSISHLSSAIQRNSDVLLALGNQQEESEVAIVNEVQKFWLLNPMFVKITIEKLLIHGCISYKSVALWFFQSTEQYYDIIELTMQRLLVLGESSSDDRLAYVVAVFQGLQSDPKLLKAFARQFPQVLQSYRHSLEMLVFKDKKPLLESLFTK